MKSAQYGHYLPPTLYRLVLRIAQRTPLGRGKFRRAIWKCFVRNGWRVIDFDVKGIKTRTHLVGNACEWKFLCNPEYIRRDVDFLAQGHTPGTANFVDIGANAGIFSLSLAALGFDVIAIEPHPEAIERLRFNVSVNGYDNRVRIYPVAVGEKAGTLELSMNDGDIGSSTMASANNGKHHEIIVRTLAEILRDAGVAKIDGLKIDVEGFEDRVLLPLFREIAEPMWPRRIVIEHIHRDRWERDCLEALLRIGYKLVFVKKSNSYLSLE